MAEATGKRGAIYVSPELHKAGRKKAADLDTSFQQVLLPMFEGWVHGHGHMPIAKPAPTESKHEKWHQLLDQVFAAGDPGQFTVITKLLETFIRSSRSAKKQVQR